MIDHTTSKTKDWIGVDFDGTLVTYPHERPIWPMVARINKWLRDGEDVQIVTSRGNNEEDADYVRQWTKAMFGKELPVRATKDHNMRELWDDRAVQLVPNTGMRVDGRDNADS